LRFAPESRLVEVYGMTEGGGATMLAAHQFPNKLHTVGRPMPGHEIRLIDEDGREVTLGHVGEVVGRSETMMTKYHNLPEKTLEAEWRDRDGRRFIRTGDIGRFDEDGFFIPSAVETPAFPRGATVAWLERGCETGMALKRPAETP
jgi:long-chain acyl-CoA synthetase